MLVALSYKVSHLRCILNYIEPFCCKRVPRVIFLIIQSVLQYVFYLLLLKDFTACVFSNRVLVPKSIDDWVLVYPQKDETSVRAFFTVFQREATRIGMNVSVPSKD